MTKNDYFSLKNITLGYTLPKAWTNRLAIQSLRVYASGDNLWLSSKRTGLDPRQAIDGSAIRTISFGISMNL